MVVVEKSMIHRLLKNSISCFDKLSMNGKLQCFNATSVRPEPVEGLNKGFSAAC